MSDSFDWSVGANVLPKCSCSDCDSVTCCALRYKCQRELCSCGNCKQSKTCLYYPNKKVSLPCCNVPTATPSDSNNKQCSCNANLNTNTKNNTALVKNMIIGTKEYRKLDVNRDFYNIYVNRKQSRPQPDTKTICKHTNPIHKKYGANEYKKLEVNKDYYNIYVNKKQPLKQVDNATDNFTVYCDNENKTYKSIRGDCKCVHKKQSSVQTDSATIKSKQANYATDKMQICDGNTCKIIDINKYNYEKYINKKPLSKQTDTATLKQTDSASIKSKQANLATDRYKIRDIIQYHYDKYVNKKESSKLADTATLKQTDSSSVNSKQSNFATNKCKVCSANKYKAHENKWNNYDIYVNKKHSSKIIDNVTTEQIESTTTKRIHPGSANRAYKFKEYETSEYTYDYGKNTTTISKKQSKYFHKTAVPRDDKYAKELESKLKRNTTHINNVSVTNGFPCNRAEIPSTAKLSSQVMAVPYNDFNESVTSNIPKHTLPKTTTLTEYEIIRRIKEAYNACSCKICECVVALTVSQAKDHCNCKPCECIECIKYRNKYRLMDSDKQVPGSGCPCIKCDRSQCKGISEFKRLQCDCPEYNNDYSTNCSCEPCQCIKCKSLFARNTRTWVVAPVDQTSSRNHCDCTPCDCLQCIQGQGVSSNRTRDISTGVNRHPNCLCELCSDDNCTPDNNATCKCARNHGVTTKPVLQNSHDYDIRRAAVNKDEKSRKNHDSITMYAAVSNTYPRFINNHKHDVNRNMPKCRCNTCECVICKLKENDTNSNKSFQLNSPVEIPILSNRNLKIIKCMCEPCECQICDQNSVIEDSTQYSVYRNGKNECEVPDVIRSRSNNSNLVNAHELVVCMFNENPVNNKKSSQLNTSDPISIQSIISNKSLKMKDCFSPLECQICNQNYDVIEDGTQDLVQSYDSLEHDAFDTLRSSTSKCTSTNNTEDVRDRRKYKRDKCTDKDIMVPSELLFHRKKEDLLTSSYNYKNVCFKNKSQTSRINSKRENSNNCTFAERHCFEQEQREQQSKIFSKKGRNSCQPAVNPVKSLIKYDNCEYDSCRQEYNKPKFSRNNELSRNSLSGYSSMASTSKVSYLNENESLKAWDSSCNSSGHDYQDYLLTFPNATVADYIRDVMDKDPKLERLSKILYKINLENGKYMKQCNKSQARKTSHIDENTNNNLDGGFQNVSNKNIQINSYKNNLFGCNNIMFFKESENVKEFDKKCDSYCVHKIDLQSQKKSSKSTLPVQNYIERNITLENIVPLPEHETKLSNNVDKNHVQFFDYTLISNKQANGTLLNDDNCTWKFGIPLQHSQHDNDMHMLYTDEVSNSVQNTLHEAKEFSLQLLKILDRYEKANRDFKSEFSEKLKTSNEQILNENIKIVDTEISKVPIINKGEAQNESLNKNDSKRNEKYFDSKENLVNVLDSTENQTNETGLNGNQFCSFNSRELINENHSEDGANINSKTEINFKSIISNEDKNKALLMSPINNEYDKTINISTKDEVDLNESSQKALREPIRVIQKEIELMHNKYDCPKTILKTFKQVNENKCNNIINHGSIIPKRRCMLNMDAHNYKCKIKKETPPEKSDINIPQIITENKTPISLPIHNIHTKGLEEYNKQKEMNMKQIVTKHGVRFDSTEDIIAFPTTIVDKGESRDNCYVPEQPIEVQVSMQSEIDADMELNESFSPNHKGWQNDRCYNSSSLHEQIHMAVNSISLQTSTSFTINYELSDSHHEHNTLVDLQGQVSELLRMPLLQSLDPVLNTKGFSISYNSPLKKKMDLHNMRDRFYNHESLTMNSQSSSDSFKVCFRNLRRVSDHTVLIKWNLPRAIDDVQGYELLVDGLPVEKFSPSRCMAVVTCLPHNDKVLLTMRTLTSKPLDAVYTSATIVYRPRIK